MIIISNFNNQANDLCDEVLKNRYLFKDSDGIVIETPDQMYWRVATFIAAVETEYGMSDSEVNNLARKYYKYHLTN